jgi:general secretion pathway protein J
MAQRMRGFSLAEMLVALAVLALVAVLLAAMVGRVGLGLAIWQRDDRAGADIAAAAFTLRQRLAMMQPVGDAQAAGTTIDFDGARTSVDFVAPAPDRDAPDALRRYRLARDSAGNLVLYSLSTLDPRTDPRALSTSGWAGEVLLTGVARLEIRYWGRNPRVIPPAPAKSGDATLRAAPAVWQGAWSHRHALPQLVAVRIGFGEADRRIWPDLIVHPHAAIAEPCTDLAPCAGQQGAT